MRDYILNAYTAHILLDNKATVQHVDQLGGQSVPSEQQIFTK